MHGEAMLNYITRPAPDVPQDAGTAYRRRAIQVLAADVETVTRATRALMDELYGFMPILPMAWDDAAAAVGWIAPEDRPATQLAPAERRKATGTDTATDTATDTGA